MRAFPVFTPVAEQGLLVEFGDDIAPEIHARVLALDRALAANPCRGIVEAVPAYASLMIRFEPVLTDHDRIAAHARGLLDGAFELKPRQQRQVQVCYDADLAPDLAAVCAATGLTAEAVIAAHLSGNYQVFLYGFAPGYAYMAGVPQALQMPRKPTPVRRVPAGSVLIAGAQCIVSTLTMPTGWWVIGRSPTRILTGDPGRPFLFDVGDAVAFQRISRAEYEALCQ